MWPTKFSRIPGFRKRSSPVYKAWASMIRRCHNEKDRDYKYYGARGITVCFRWHDLQLFLADMGPSFRSGLTLERKHVHGNYEPDNCRWATRKEQAINRTSSNLLTNPKTGESCTVSDWARRYGLSRNTITSRIRLGYTDFFILVGEKHAMRNGIKKTSFAEEARNVAD